MTLARYLCAEILLPSALGVTLLLLVFAAFSASEILADAVAGRVPAASVAALIGLRCVIASEVLLPTAFFLGTVWAFTRLDRDSELTIVLAAGFHGVRLIALVGVLGAIVAGSVTWLSLEARPWAYRLSHALERQVLPEDVASLEARRFYRFGEAMTLFADAVDRPRASMEDVFAERRMPVGTELIRANEFSMSQGENEGERLLEFRDGAAWRVDPRRLADRVHEFEVLRYRAAVEPPAEGRVGRRAKSFAELRHSSAPKDVAERQWRLVIGPLSLLMAWVAMRLGRGRPRQGIYGRLLTAVVVYIAVFNLAAMARTWVESGAVTGVPGVWWVLLVPLVLMFATGRSWRA